MNSTASNLDNQSTFTYEEGKKYFEGLNVNCSSDEYCPNHTFCSSDRRPEEHHSCRNNDKSCHCLSQFYCKKNKSVCSFNYDENEGINFKSYISSSRNDFGLEIGNKCRYNGECFDGRCSDRNFFGIGKCNYPTDSTNLEGFAFLLFIIPMILIITIISIILCRKCKVNPKKEKKYKSLKLLIISDAVAVSILLLFIIFLVIDNYLNKQPLH